MNYEVKIKQCLFLLLLSIISCHENDHPPISIADAWECHSKTEWDEIKTRDALLGLWKWEYFASSGSPEENQYVTDKELTIEFKADSTLIVMKHDTIIQTSVWMVVHGDANLYAIEEVPHVSQLFGRILFCDDLVLFNGTYIDVGDNYFRRVK